MSTAERVRDRDRRYSRWHREANMRRLLSLRDAYRLGMIDLDAVDFCRRCSQPLVLIETQVSAGPPKGARVTATLAARAGLEAYSVSVRVPDEHRCEDPNECVCIDGFAVRRLHPPGAVTWDMSPSEYALWLLHFHNDHRCEVPA